MPAIPEILIWTFHDFSWLNPLLDLSQKRMLEENDMYDILPEDQSETVGEELQRYFRNVMSLCLNVSGNRRPATVWDDEYHLCF